MDIRRTLQSPLRAMARARQSIERHTANFERASLRTALAQDSADTAWQILCSSRATQILNDRSLIRQTLALAEKHNEPRIMAQAVRSCTPADIQDIFSDSGLLDGVLDSLYLRALEEYPLESCASKIVSELALPMPDVISYLNGKSLHYMNIRPIYSVMMLGSPTLSEDLRIYLFNAADKKMLLEGMTKQQWIIGTPIHIGVPTDCKVRLLNLKTAEETFIIECLRAVLGRSVQEAVAIAGGLRRRDEPFLKEMLVDAHKQLQNNPLFRKNK